MFLMELAGWLVVVTAGLCSLVVVLQASVQGCLRLALFVVPIFLASPLCFPYYSRRLLFSNLLRLVSRAALIFSVCRNLALSLLASPRIALPRAAVPLLFCVVSHNIWFWSDNVLQRLCLRATAIIANMIYHRPSPKG